MRSAPVRSILAPIHDLSDRKDKMPRHPAQPSVRVAPFMGLPALLEEFRVEPADLLAELHLSLRDFENPEDTIPYRTAALLFGLCVRRTRCPHFGLLLGQRVGVTVLGTVGYLMQSSPDVRSALSSLSKFLHVHDTGGIATLVEQGRFATLSYEILRHDVPNADQILDFSMTIGLNLMRGLCGPGWKASQVHLAHDYPPNIAPFRSTFGGAPRFDAEVSALVFGSPWLDRPVASADPILHKLMANRIRQLEADHPQDLVTRVRRALQSAIPGEACSLDVIAARLALPNRTLNRHLQSAGVSFAQLRDEVRFAAACRLLANTAMSASEVALSLGYSDPSTFTRAFRRWSGTAPAHWRARKLRVATRH
jgi:AraC-like DNA-binding protein